MGGESGDGKLGVELGMSSWTGDNECDRAVAAAATATAVVAAADGEVFLLALRWDVILDRDIFLRRLRLQL